jgi:centractin
MSQEGKSFSRQHFVNLTVINRDVTDHLQLLLRKSGHHLHTTAEREVVRTMKEKCCYIAINPSKEEKESLGRMEEFTLPDGNVVQVSPYSYSRNLDIKQARSSVLNVSEHQKFYSIPS